MSPEMPLAEQHFPLSLVQQRLWLLNQLDPGNPAYNLPMIAFRLRGRLPVARLQDALGEIGRRHEALRTAFPAVGGEPRQEVKPPAVEALPVVDLSGLPGERGQRLARRLAVAEARRRFDLAAGPPWRRRLLRLGDEEHLLLSTLHHIVSDAWSIGVLFRELAALFVIYGEGLPSALPELPLQYGELAQRQRQSLRQEIVEDDLRFWRRQLEEAPATVVLPTDRPRPSRRTFRGKRHIAELPPGLPEALAGLAQEARVSLYMVLLAAFNALLGRYTGQDDLLLGSPVAGRTSPEAEQLIGFFVNTVVVRTRLTPGMTFRQLLRAVREEVLDIYDHQELPFDRLVEELQPRRDLAYDPIFQIMFSLQNARIPVLELGGLEVRSERIHNGTCQFELILFAGADRWGTLTTIQIEYNTDLFDATTIRRLEGHLLRFLEAALERPDRPLEALPLLSPGEGHQLLFDWAARDGGRASLCLHDLFEARCRENPRRTAVVWEAETQTYGELAARVHRLANHLIHLGVGPETRVALCLERTPALVVAILAVLEAGGAYVPLDPAYPSERLDFLVRDSAAAVLVRKGGHPAGWRPPPEVPVVDLDAVEDQIRGESDAVPRRRVHPEQLAYVIYTSGSTGTPKGVAVSHANVVRLLSSCERWFGFGPQDVWTLFHSHAFDFSVWELWGALAHGGSVVLVPDWVRHSPEAFRQLLVGEGVTVLNQTPSAFRQLVALEAAAGAAEPLALRWVIFGGEALEFASLRPWVQRHGDASPRLINMYGITETTVHVTYRPVREAEVVTGSTSRIGRPLPDLSVYVLDRNLHPVPVGVPGELCVAGAGLARGYLHRPALTAQRFVPRPFGEGPGERLYRSGDLARWRPDGDLEVLGRSDDQVKIRGFRIELREIEAALGRHPELTAQVVMARPGPDGQLRLVAYAVPARRGAVSPAELGEFLRRSLPEYMVPSFFVLLEALPLTRNGKVDRRALPEPGSAGSREEAIRVAPRTPTEKRIAALWCRLVGTDAVAADDNFFESGGHSLLATRLVSAIREQLGVNLSVRVVFETPTLAQIAAAVDRARQEGGEAVEVAPAVVATRRRVRRRPVS